MTRKTLFALLAGFIAAIGITGAAPKAKADGQHNRSGMSQYGNMGIGGHQRGGWYSNRGHRGLMMRGRINRLMDRYDTNNDGNLTQDEINSTRSKIIDQYDKDKNGKLSLGEFQNLWIKRNNRRMVRSFQRFDKDGDAQITREEYNQPTARLVERLDRNRDGTFSPQDRPGNRYRRQGHGYWNDRDADDRDNQDRNEGRMNPPKAQ